MGTKGPWDKSSIWVCPESEKRPVQADWTGPDAKKVEERESDPRTVGIGILSKEGMRQRIEDQKRGAEEGTLSEWEIRDVDLNHFRDYPSRFTDIDAEGSKRRNCVGVGDVVAGRWHLQLQDTGFEDRLRPLLTALVPFVNCYFEKSGLGADNLGLGVRKDLPVFIGTKKQMMASMEGREFTEDEWGNKEEKVKHPVPFIATLHGVLSRPLCTTLFWHRDNVSPGLTVFIPLTYHPADSGATVVLPYTHRLFACSARYSDRLKNSFLKSSGFIRSLRGEKGILEDGEVKGGPFRLACNPGDIVFHDSRLLKSAVENRRWGRSYFGIWVRFDATQGPGPWYKIMWMAPCGHLINFFNWLGQYT